MALVCEKKARSSIKFEPRIEEQNYGSKILEGSEYRRYVAGEALSSVGLVDTSVRRLIEDRPKSRAGAKRKGKMILGRMIVSLCELGRNE